MAENSLPLPTGLDAQTWRRMLVVMERLAGSSNLEEVLSLIIDSMRDCLHADRASVFQFDKKTQELFITQAHGLQAIRFPLTKGIAGEAARTGQIVNVPDCYADPRFNQAIDKQTGYRTRNMLTIPLVSADSGLEGVAQVLNKEESQGSAFDESDEALARALASQAAVAIRRARLIEAEVRKKKIEADLAVARTIQQSCYPKQLPQVEGYQIAASSLPADETGGDAFDLIDLRTIEGVPDACRGGGGVVFLMGDATGHGVGPALSVAQFRAMVRMGVRTGCDLDRIVEQMNYQLCEDLPPGRFVTAFVGLLDPAINGIRYVSAGQAPMLLLRADGSVEERPANGMPLGVAPELAPDPVEPFRLEPGDVFLMLSDGYYEAMSSKEGLFGSERVVAAAREALSGTPEQIIAAVQRAADAFVCGRPYDDDRTAVVIKRVHA